MRYTFMALLFAMALPAGAQINAGMSERLCQAASEESAFGVLVDDLIETGELALTSGEEVLSLDCRDGRSVLETMVIDRQAENLEYAVIDLGLNLSASTVMLHGRTLSLKAALKQLGEQGNGDVREFVQSYLSDLADEDFNPNLRVSLK
ncbi:MAG: hypothetical protein VX793_10405 [Pseudomonadota bacterium]|nr:hypothetical protein [Pseudomonadota bacterium]